MSEVVARGRDEVLEVGRWARGIEGVHRCIGARFHRSEPEYHSGVRCNSWRVVVPELVFEPEV